MTEVCYVNHRKSGPELESILCLSVFVCLCIFLSVYLSVCLCMFV